MLDHFSDTDTIAAISTPRGKGGISIVKISGTESFSISEKIFKSQNKIQQDRNMVFGYITDGSKFIDTVLLCRMKSPKTYTGEDTVEIHCHGGYAAADTILRLIISKGSRPAKPGEFTKRAFLNGKIDLIQAESVLEITSAKTEKDLEQSMKHLDGHLSNKINDLINNIQSILTSIEYEIDFSSDNDPQNKGYIGNNLKTIESEIECMLSTYSKARYIKDGVRIILTGKVNTGKSSLFNKILGKKRSIVNKKPGTTRDWIEGTLEIDGILINLIDTAGIRETDDEIEMEGISDTEKLIKTADIIIHLDDFEIFPPQKFHFITEKQIIIKVHSKSDINPQKYEDYISVSSETDEGIQELIQSIKTSINNLTSDPNDTLLTIERHYRELSLSYTAIKNAHESLLKWSEEIISLHLNDALLHLNSIVGKNISYNVLDDIFKHFCVGK